LLSKTEQDKFYGFGVCSMSDLENLGVEQVSTGMRFRNESALRSITKEEYERLASFRYHLRQFLRVSEAAARTVGLTSRQHQTLLAIMGFPGGSITVGQLAQQLQVAHHTTVELVDRLRLQKLVARETSTSDRRRVYVKLTQRGLATLETLTWAHRDELRRLSTYLGSLFLKQLVTKEVGS
jgi:DNA-binding MarR family transcriptional regulator